MKRILAVVGDQRASVGFAAIEQTLDRMGAATPFECLLVHAEAGPHIGQRIGLRSAEYVLEIDAGAVPDRIAALMPALRGIVERERPAAMLVFGDHASALAGAIVAGHAGLPLAHLGSGERRYRGNRDAGEMNQVATDHLADLNLVTSRRAERLLRREGLSPEKIRYVGDPLFDAYRQDQEAPEQAPGIAASGDGSKEYILAVIGSGQGTAWNSLAPDLLETLAGARLPVLVVGEACISERHSNLTGSGKLRTIGAPDRQEFMPLLRLCALVVCDASDAARLAQFAGKPMIVPQDAWWAAEAIESGLAKGVDLANPVGVLRTIEQLIDQDPAISPAGPFGEGNAGSRIVNALTELISRKPPGSGGWRRLGHTDDLPPPADASGFSYASYEAMIRSLQSAAYAFRGFDAISDPDAGRYCLMRHDIDFDLGKAAEMAALETELGVSATYFFMLRTGHYNLFSIEGSQFCREILGMGHRLGLHFDLAAYSGLDDAGAVRAAVEQEAEILEKWFGRPVEAVSFHRPNAYVLQGDPALTGPLPHSYSAELKSRTAYCADSGGAWKHGAPTAQEAFRRGEPLHILVHPIWWDQEPSSPVETLERFFDRASDQLMLSTARNCRPFRVGRFARMAYAD